MASTSVSQVEGSEPAEGTASEDAREEEASEEETSEEDSLRGGGCFGGGDFRGRRFGGGRFRYGNLRRHHLRGRRLGRGNLLGASAEQQASSQQQRAEKRDPFDLFITTPPNNSTEPLFKTIRPTLPFLLSKQVHKIVLLDPYFRQVPQPTPSLPTAAIVLHLFTQTTAFLFIITFFLQKSICASILSKFS